MFPINHEKITALMHIFCQKNVNFLKNTLLTCPYFVKKRPFSQKHCAFMSLFFQFFYEKPPPLMPIFGQKNLHSVKTTLYYGPKKSIVCTEPIFCRKNVHYLKNTTLSWHFFQFFMKNPCCHAHIWSKKRKFCQNYTILWVKKSQ